MVLIDLVEQFVKKREFLSSSWFLSRFIYDLKLLKTMQKSILSFLPYSPLLISEYQCHVTLFEGRC